MLYLSQIVIVMIKTQSSRPLKLAIKLALSDIQPQLDEIQNHIRTKVVM
jgi:hypothetical protein